DRRSPDRRSPGRPTGVTDRDSRRLVHFTTGECVSSAVLWPRHGARPPCSSGARGHVGPERSRFDLIVELVTMLAALVRPRSVRTGKASRYQTGKGPNLRVATNLAHRDRWRGTPCTR